MSLVALVLVAACDPHVTPRAVVDPTEALRPYVVGHTDADPGSYTVVYVDADGVVRGFQHHLGEWHYIDGDMAGLPSNAEAVAPIAGAPELMSLAVRMSDGSIQYVRETSSGSWRAVDVGATARMRAVEGRIAGLAVDERPAVAYLGFGGELRLLRATGPTATIWVDAPVVGAPPPSSDALTTTGSGDLFYPAATAGSPVRLRLATGAIGSYPDAPPMIGLGTIDPATDVLIYPTTGRRLALIDATGAHDLTKLAKAPLVDSDLAGGAAVVYRAVGGALAMIERDPDTGAWTYAAPTAEGAPPAVGTPIYLSWQGSVDDIVYVSTDGHVHAIERMLANRAAGWSHIDLTATVTAP